jgi:crotonobetainyl-CoA:carnitine CoA-transferase CaiB-like acyl-CoA transferase
LTEAIGRPELREDPRFKRRDERIKNYAALHDICQEVFATAPRDVWVERLRVHDVPSGPLYGIDEVFDDPQVRHHGMAIELEHPRKGSVRLAGSAVNMKGTPIRYEAAPPLLGEHTEAILAQAGYDADRIKQLAEAGAI